MARQSGTQSWLVRVVGGVEHGVKGPLLDCSMCGQCVARTCQMVCPMRCPKGLRNGPCGGSEGGRCEVDPARPCVWSQIWERADRRGQVGRILEVQPPLDWRLKDTPAWLNLATGTIDLDGHPRDGWLAKEYQPDGSMQAETRLETTLRGGEFAVTAEIVPPRVPDLALLQKRVDALRGRVHAVNVTDNAAATVKMPSWAVCASLIQNGIEPIFQQQCRDRNRLALQSDLLGAYALGVRNVFVVSGDSVTIGDHPQARPVHDVDAVQLLAIYHRLRSEGKLASGSDLQSGTKGPFVPRLFLGCAGHPTADPLRAQVLRLLKKARAGADFVQTQCLFDLKRFEQFMQIARDEGVTERLFILPGIMPVRTARAFEFLRKVPGIHVPDDLVRRLGAAEDKDEEGLRIAAELLEGVRSIPGVAGVHLMAPYWEVAIPALLERVQATSRSGCEAVGASSPTPECLNA
jgi:methylenetetrahydrofolate reductase (NADH)